MKQAFLLTLVISLSAAGLATADELVVVGVGRIGPFDTTLEIANPTAASMTVVFNNAPPENTGCPGTGPPCVPSVTIPAHGSVTVDSTKYSFGALDLLYIGVLGAPGLPSVRATISNQNLAPQVVSLPVASRDALVEANPTLLSFAGATRSATAHSNLVLANVYPTDASKVDPLSVTMTAYDAVGGVRGSLNAVVTDHPLFLVDICGQLGVPTMDKGHIEVAKVSGNGLLTGLMITTTPGGGIAVSAPAH